ncbi:hypothetical protein B0H10DRAFT_2134657, partial [Mycena sp. CBHHK59/15]
PPIPSRLHASFSFPVRSPVPLGHPRSFPIHPLAPHASIHPLPHHSLTSTRRSLYDACGPRCGKEEKTG